MKLGVLSRRREPISFRIYRESLMRELKSLGVESVSLFEADQSSTECELVWDPGLGVLSLPRLLIKRGLPIVATIHGAAAFSLPVEELTRRRRDRLQLCMWKFGVTSVRRLVRQIVSVVIAVSEYGAIEIARAFKLPNSIIYPIHHGVDHRIYHPNGDNSALPRAYVLHVSAYAPKKNLDRIFAAYARVPNATRPQLVVVQPDYEGNEPEIAGVKLIREQVSQAELARWYRGALGLVFPSLHESFGLPILEAMACGCPVITSNVAACPEVAGDAALLVNPRSVDEIAAAMLRLSEDKDLRGSLRERGLARARRFTWRDSAEKHLEVFNQVLKDAR